MDLAKITIFENHRVQTGSVAPLAISIDGQNGVDELAFEVPAGMEDWAWRVEIEQGGKKTWRLLGAGNVWAIRAGEVAEGYAKMQLVGSRASGEDAEVWKSREFDVNVLPAINAAEAMEPGEASELDRIAAEVKGDADRADAAATRAEDAAAGAENIVNTAISGIEAEGQKQAAAVASSGTQALEAIGKVEQTAIAQVQAAGTTQVGAVEDAGDGKLAEIDAANAHVPQINETTGKWQVWDAQTGAYVDTDTNAQGPQGETGATGPQGPAGADGIGLPAATAEDAGKVPVVGADGSYTLGEPVPEVDTTLTEAGAPADAAAVGEAIEAISPDDGAVDGKPWTSKQIVDVLCPPLEASGNPVQCYPVANYPLGVKASWEPRQEGDGDPSPDNVRPIFGRNQVTVTKCGKNLLNPEKVAAVSDYYGLTVTYEGENIFHIVGKPNNPDNGNLSFVVAETLDYSLSGKGLVVTAFSLSGNLTVVGAYGLRTSTENAIAITAYLDNTVTYDARIQLAVGVENLTTYEPYTGTTATLDLPSTVYGGEVDLATGKGKRTVDVISLAVADMNNLEKYPGWKHQQWIGDYVENTNQDAQFVYAANYIISNADGDKRLRFNAADDVYFDSSAIGLTQSQFKSQYPDLVFQFAFERLTPATFQATGSQSLPALSGENVLITNADSLTVTGRADPVATVQALADRVAALEQAAVNLTNNTTEG